MVYICVYIYTIVYIEYIHNELLLSHKKNEILPFATTWMDLDGIMLSEMSDRERQILYVITYPWTLKNKTNKGI